MLGSPLVCTEQIDAVLRCVAIVLHAKLDEAIIRRMKTN